MVSVKKVLLTAITYFYFERRIKTMDDKSLKEFIANHKDELEHILSVNENNYIARIGVNMCKIAEQLQIENEEMKKLITDFADAKDWEKNKCTCSSFTLQYQGCSCKRIGNIAKTKNKLLGKAKVIIENQKGKLNG